tara:strand:- start:884 stop:1537 length:654 start_codon:yes stop_codon:yes gene_type:complete
MKFEKLLFKKIPKSEMLLRSKAFYNEIKKRRTVRDFSSEKVPIEVVVNAIKSASTAPSGANKQPWHFAVVADVETKKKIRVAAEKEEKAFYDYRASQEWLDDLKPLGTNYKKQFLETAPYLIAVFKKNYDIKNKKQKKNYYVNESVGIASGILLSALHHSGLATLTHTPSPMGFLEKILGRPSNEKAVLLIPVGYASGTAKVPRIEKKDFRSVCTIF